MIVYGDPSYAASFLTFVDRLCKNMSAAQTANSLDVYRTLLVHAGQLEQACADAWPRDPIVRKMERLTDLAADCFLSVWMDTQPDLDLPRPDLMAAREAMLRQVDELPARTEQINVKVPEGFAFYTLYPEAYVLSTLRWLEEIDPAFDDQILVVGVRSIGTTLSAIVRSTLAANRCLARRTTLRPTGDYFDRKSKIDSGEIQGVKWCLVTDEGPGLSGSSMASVAEGLLQAGFGPDGIAFLPGHTGDPGRETSERNRKWWAKTPRYAIHFKSLSWNGMALEESLARKSEALMQDTVIGFEDMSYGRWRQAVYENEDNWPPQTGPFEKTKFRVLLKSGKAIFWKFEGFINRHERWESCDEWSQKPIAHLHGFTATEWIDGKRMNPSQADQGVQSQLCAHTLAVACPPLEESESRRAKERLALVTAQNLTEAFGADVARKACMLIDFGSFDPKRPSYGDGRMAPEEWILRDDGSMIKGFSHGHDRDHTIVGQQPILWDIAATLVEWDLDETSGAAYLHCLGSLELIDVFYELGFYQIAYCSFRLGQCSFVGSQMGNDPAEVGRQQRAEQRYREKLRVLLYLDR